MQNQSLHLYLDIGNTRIKWALADPNSSRGQWYRCGAYTYQPDTYLALIDEIKKYPIAQIWCANVAGSPIQGMLEASLTHLSDNAIVRYATVAKTFLHLRNGYDEPHRLGIDRWLAALAASSLYSKRGLFIISMGTATTIDLVDAQANFLGGWILPGVTAMLTSLGQTTAQLPILEMNQHISLNKMEFGRDTAQAMHRGCLAAQIGAIKYGLNLSSAYIGSDPICILTGGARQIIVNQLDCVVIDIPDLVLQGLQIYAAAGKEKD